MRSITKQPAEAHLGRSVRGDACINSSAVTPHSEVMATLTIRNLPDDVRDRLRLRAAAHGRSMEAEARDLLQRAVARGGDLSAVARQREKIEEARRLLRRSIPEGTPLVDQFLAERRGTWGDVD